MEKDFYDRLPSFVCEELDMIENKYKNEAWFDKAWEEYRKHVMFNTRNSMRMPGYIFNKYIDKEN